MKTRPAEACLVIASGLPPTRQLYNLFGVCESARLGCKLWVSRPQNKISIITAAMSETIETVAYGNQPGMAVKQSQKRFDNFIALCGVGSSFEQNGIQAALYYKSAVSYTHLTLPTKA